MKMRILIVDDEHIVRKGMRKIIEEAKEEWEVAGMEPDGIRAMEFMESEIPDVVITDIRMASMDGISLAKRIKERYPDMLIIVVSGYSEFAYAQEAVKFGALDYLLKPTPPKELIRILKKAEEILRSRQNQQAEQAILAERLVMQSGALSSDESGSVSGSDSGNASGGAISNALIEDAVLYMRRHFSEELTTRGMSELLHINTNYFCDLFRRETGHTFTEYLTEIRVNAAKRILAQKIGVKAGEVAAMVGYTDARYFSRVFKASTGMTPSEFRESVRKV